MSNITILGAGLSGLLAGALDRHAMILERQPSLPHNHHAVLRFRDDKIARALDIPFRKVRVHKAVADAYYSVRNYILPADINCYSQKALGAYSTRSIIDLSPADRFIAPSDFIQQLADMCRGRIEYGVHVGINQVLDAANHSSTIVSTIPLPHMMEIAGLVHGDKPEFKAASIRVLKFTLPGADLFQTIYFPYDTTPLYRATITRDEVILELAEELGELSELQLNSAMQCFGINYKHLVPKEIKRQGLGKISPIKDDVRRAILYQLTKQLKIYSIGRFACWRNILLDDVFDDYWKVKKMIALNEYDFNRSLVQ